MEQADLGVRLRAAVQPALWLPPSMPRGQRSKFARFFGAGAPVPD
jgi:hypothetical protein